MRGPRVKLERQIFGAVFQLRAISHEQAMVVVAF
jgi:hypothetical protein